MYFLASRNIVLINAGSVGFGVVMVVGSYAFLALNFIIYLSEVLRVGDFQSILHLGTILYS